ncbi:MAG: hypothetical protein AAGA25_09310 [Planctomycetota bacterium]
MSGHHSDSFRQTRRVKMSGNKPPRPRLAVIALALGCAAWALPAAPVIVLILGVVAWFSAKHAAGARKMATGALALGVLGLSLQGYLGFEFYQDLNQGPAEAAAQSQAYEAAHELAIKDDEGITQADEAE